MTSPLLWSAAAVIGACVGSFAATQAVRAGVGESAFAGRSRCDTCRAPLGFAATAPLVSWVVRGGVCSTCRAPISGLHPLGELSGAILGLLTAVVATSPAQGLLMAFLVFALLASALIDFRTQRLPDPLTLVIAVCGGGLAGLRGQGALIEGAVAAAVAFLILEGLRRGFLALRGRPGLGFGDVKLIAALGLWLGAVSPWAVALAASLGLIAFAVRRPADGRAPFGPWLAAGAILVGLTKEAGLWPSLA